MENKVVKVDGVVTVETLVSKKKRKEYKAVFLTVNGQKLQVSFVNDYIELNLLKAGVRL